MVSYLTPLTGLTAGILQERGKTLAEALSALKAGLPTNAVLVGQNIAKDVQWLGKVIFLSALDLLAGSLCQHTGLFLLYVKLIVYYG